MKKNFLPVIMCSVLLLVGCSEEEQKSDIIVQTDNANTDTFNTNNTRTISITKDKHSNADWFKWKLSTENLDTLREMKIVGSYSSFWNVYESDDGKLFVLVNDELVELISDNNKDWRLKEVPEVLRSDLGNLVTFQSTSLKDSKGVIVNGQVTNKTVATTIMDISSFKKDLKLSLKDKVILGESGESSTIVYDSTNATLYNLEDVLSLLNESPVAAVEGFKYVLNKDNLTLSVTRNSYFSASFDSGEYCCVKPLTLNCELSEDLEVFTDDSSTELLSDLKGGTNQIFLKPLVDSKGVWVTDDFLEKWLGIWFRIDEESNEITDVAFSEKDLVIEVEESPFRKE